MVGAEELLRLITFSELMNVGQMSHASVPIRGRLVGKFLPAVTADIRRSKVHGGRSVVRVVTRWVGGLTVKGRVEAAGQGGT